MKNKVLVVGAGFSGAVIARELAESGYAVDVIESRGHIAGNCFTKTDEKTGVMVHAYGPHIFHTDNEDVWNYLNKYSTFHDYTCQVKATTQGRVFSLPINLLTINQFFNTTLNPSEAKEFISKKTEKIANINSFEDQALAFLGRELYEAFFKGYPIKQWGLHPSELPASVLKRLPVRFNYNDNYFNHKYQGIPSNGYTSIVEKLLDHELITVFLNRKYTNDERQNYDHIFFSGPLDSWFNYKLGRLGYRTLRFETSYHDDDFQGCAVMSYPDLDVDYTRITEHKHFTPWLSHEKTIVFHEYSSYCKEVDEPYYPIRLANDESMLLDYIDIAKKEENVTFVGRLGTYRYLDMDVTIAEALNIANSFKKLKFNNEKVPAFFNSPV